MVCDIVKDISLLSVQSERFDKTSTEHRALIDDLFDTAKAYESNCAGLAAVQIGKPIKCFVYRAADKFRFCANPLILRRSPETYITEEGCLSLDGTRNVKRHTWIDVIYSTDKGKPVKERLSGYTAEIFQHEYDHLQGVLI